MKRALRRLSIAAPCLAIALSTTAARAGVCQRPTDPGGFDGYSYGTDPVASFDGKHVRVWYTITGTHAVNPASTRADGVPDVVVTAATVADDALDQYAQRGFRAPLSDMGAGTDCGGSPALDIYLMHFHAADGDTATEGCTQVGKAATCWTFGQVESRLDSLYGSFELGAHVVIAHELMHSVQDAYDANLDHFWAEGTAQWAAKSIYPAEKDFESFLPAFFANAGQSIDLNNAGVVGDYLYGSAIWPLFLTQAVSPDAVRVAFEKEATLGPPSMNAIATALPSFSSSMEDAYPTFAAWNAATGARAGTGGYPDAASYPAVTLTPFTSPASAIATGWSVFFYQYDFGAVQTQLAITADPTRLAAKTFPLVDGKAHLDQLTALPATVSGAGVIVVAGISSKKSDAPFTVTATTAPPADSSAPTATAATTNSGGCAMGHGEGSTWIAGAFAFATLAIARRRR